MTRSGPSLCAVVLAAGAGTRLRPLTDLLPKALCPIANVPLVELALQRVWTVLGTGDGDVDRVTVNAHHHLDAMRARLSGRVYLSLETEQALGTAGAIGRLRDWIDGRGVLIHNVDAWHADDLTRLVEGWDGERVRLLVTYDPAHPDIDGAWRFVGVSLLPWRLARALPPEPAGLYESCWSPELDADRVDLVPTRAVAIDCGTPADYLGANLVASGGDSVIAPDAVLRGHAYRSVILGGAVVAAGERLRYAIRLPDGRTLQPLRPS